MSESSATRHVRMFLTQAPSLGLLPRTIAEYGRILAGLASLDPRFPHPPPALAGFVYSPTTTRSPAQPPLVRLRLATVRTFYRWALLMGHVSRDPSRALPTPPRVQHVPKIPSLPELRAWLARLEPVPRAVAMLLILTGHRIRELLALEWVDLGPGSITSPSATGYVLRVKGGRRVRFVLPPAALPFVDRLRGGDDRFLIPWSEGALRRAFREAGDIRPHALRHATAQIHLRLGATLTEIRDLLSHRALSSTERYLQGLAPGVDRLADDVALLITSTPAKETS